MDGAEKAILQGYNEPFFLIKELVIWEKSISTRICRTTSGQKTFDTIGKRNHGSGAFDRMGHQHSPDDRWNNGKLNTNVQMVEARTQP